jgi:hypothetical protein
VSAETHAPTALEVVTPRQKRYLWPLLEAAIARGHTVALEVRGRSMWPALQSGDHVGVRGLRETPRLGEVVVYRHGQRALAHRVVEIGGDPRGETFVKCRGDATRRVDPPVWLRDVVGVVVYVERRGKRIRPLAGAALISRLLARVRPGPVRLRKRKRARAERDVSER